MPNELTGTVKTVRRKTASNGSPYILYEVDAGGDWPNRVTEFAEQPTYAVGDRLRLEKAGRYWQIAGPAKAGSAEPAAPHQAPPAPTKAAAAAGIRLYKGVAAGAADGIAHIISDLDREAENYLVIDADGKIWRADKWRLQFKPARPPDIPF